MAQTRFNITTTDHTGHLHWLHIRQNLPNRVIGFNEDGVEILNPFSKLEIANCLYNMTIKNWLLALQAFEDDSFDLDETSNRNAIDKTREWAIETYDYVTDDTPFEDNMNWPIYRVFPYWTKPMPNNNQSILWCSHGGNINTPFSFDISSNDTPLEALDNLQLMKMNAAASHQRELSIERPSIDPPHKPERVEFALDMQEHPGTFNEHFQPPAQQPNGLPPPDVIISGRFNRKDYEKQYVKGDVFKFETVRCEWVTKDNGKTELQFFGENCQHPYPFKVNEKNYDYIDTGKELLPTLDQRGSFDTQFVKARIGDSFEFKGTVYKWWNVIEVWTNAYDKEELPF